MIFKVSKFYKFFVIFATLISTPMVLILFSLELSNLALFLVTFTYISLLLILVEAIFFRLKLDNKTISCIYFVLDLSDIINVRCNIFGTKLVTRWKVYNLPPLEKSRIFCELAKNQIREMQRIKFLK